MFRIFLKTHDGWSEVVEMQTEGLEAMGCHLTGMFEKFPQTTRAFGVSQNKEM